MNGGDADNTPSSTVEYVTLTLKVSNTGSATFQVDGEPYEAGDVQIVKGREIYLKCDPVEGYVFSKWRDQDSSVASNNPILLTVSASMTMVAVTEEE